MSCASSPPRGRARWFCSGGRPRAEDAGCKTRMGRSPYPLARRACCPAAGGLILASVIINHILVVIGNPSVRRPTEFLASLEAAFGGRWLNRLYTIVPPGNLIGSNKNEALSWGSQNENLVPQRRRKRNAAGVNS